MCAVAVPNCFSFPPVTFLSFPLLCVQCLHYLFYIKGLKQKQRPKTIKQTSSAAFESSLYIISAQLSI